MRKKLIKLARMVMRFAEIVTDKATLIYDGELAEGVEVSVEKEGEIVTPENGEYLTETLKITVEEGKITKIEDIEVEETVEDVEEETTEETIEEPVELSKLEIKQAEFSISYEETERKLAEAIGDCWIIEAGDNYCIAGKYDEDSYTEKYFRYSYTMENDEIVLGEFVEVFPRFVSADEIAKLTEDNSNEVVELQSEIDRLNELLQKPVEESVKLAAVAKETTTENKALQYFK